MLVCLSANSLYCDDLLEATMLLYIQFWDSKLTSINWNDSLVFMYTFYSIGANNVFNNWIFSNWIICVCAPCVLFSLCITHIVQLLRTIYWCYEMIFYLLFDYKLLNSWTNFMVWTNDRGSSCLFPFIDCQKVELTIVKQTTK